VNDSAIEQWCDFGPLRVGYDDSVLAPRPWTVLQSRHAAALVDGRPDGPLLELHCGAGHIGQAAAVWSRRPLVQVDDNPAACRWARRNADVNAVPAEVRCSRIEGLTEPDGKFALVLADPPYVPSSETGRFADDPLHAIDGGDDGLDGVRLCLPVATRLTRPGGMVVLQVRGPAQAHTLGRVVADEDLGLDVVGMVAVSTDRALVLLTRR
jgi:release factor glutamine methyltransferase